MEQLKNIIKNEILPSTDSLNGFSIFKYNATTFDIYIPTRTIEAFYFTTYCDGAFFDIHSNQIKLTEIETCRYTAVDLIDKNHPRVLNYSKIYIEEHEMLSYREYKSPKETGASEYLELGYSAYQNEDYEKAFNFYNQGILLKPYDHSLYSARANCFKQSKQYENAVADLCRAGISNPVSQQNIFVFTYEAIGNMYNKVGDFKNAIKHYTIVINNDDGWTALPSRAKCYSELNMHELAIKDIESILDEERKIQTLLMYAKACIKGDLTTKATDILNEVINYPRSNSNQNWINKMVEAENQPIKEEATKLLRDIQ